MKSKASHIDVKELVSDTSEVLWTSFWIRRATLISMALIFSLCAAGVVIVWRCDVSANGFVLTSTNTHHYAWTYGPAALLVVLLGIWRQIDFYYKLTQPWRGLSSGFREAESNLLLDYLTPLNIVSFMRALRQKHLLVAASIAGFACLKLILLFCTGLLVVTPTLLTTSMQGTSLSEIGMTSDLRNASLGRYSGTISPIHRYVGILNGDYQEPPSISNNTVLQRFSFPQAPGLREASMSVNALKPEISCDIADVRAPFQVVSGYSHIQLVSPRCSVGTPGHANFTVPTFDCEKDCRGNSVQYYYQPVRCDDLVGPSSNSTNQLVDRDGSSYIAIWLANVTIDYIPVANVSQRVEYWNRTSAVICKVDYAVGQTRVRFDLAANATSIASFNTSAHIGNFSAGMLINGVNESLKKTRGLLLPGQTGDYDQLNPHVRTPMYHILLKALSGQQTFQGLLDQETLRRAATASWSGLVAHWMHESAVIPSSSAVTIDMTYSEDRLHVAVPSFAVMLAGFIAMALLSALLATVAPAQGLVGHPLRNLTYVKLMAASPTLEKHLSGSGGFSKKQIERRTHSHTYQLADGAQRSILTHRSHQPLQEAVLSKTKPWVPLAARHYMVAITCLTPLLAIIVLEVVYKCSVSKSGIADVTGIETNSTFLSRYLSALAMLGIATAFSALDFTIALFAPYSILRTGMVTQSRGLNFQILGEVPLLALYRSLQARHGSSALSNLASLIGSALTIVASGLWIVNRSVITITPVQATLGTSFNTSWHNSSMAGDGGASLRLAQAQRSEALMPSTIWNDYVIPDVLFFAPGSVRPSTIGMHHTITLPALRPVLSCEIIENEYLAMEEPDFGTEVEGVTEVTMTPPLEPKCRHAGPDGKNSFYNFTASFWTTRPNATRIVGLLTDLHLGPWRADPTEKTAGESGELPINLSIQRDNPPGCPSLGIVLGRNVLGEHNLNDITALLCSQKIERANLEVTYNADTQRPTISTSVPPRVINGSSTWVASGTDGETSFPYRIETYLTKAFLPMLNAKDVYTVRLDPFIERLNSGSNGTTEQLLGKDNRQAFVSAAQKLYAQYMSLVIDLKFRTTYSEDLSDVRTVNGSTYTISSRLQVNYTSKIALQIMLAVMSCFGFLAYWFADLRDTLPREPSTIASIMALLADSGLCSEANEAFEEASSSGKTFYPNKFYSLGWWPSTKFTASWPEEQPLTTDTRFGIDEGVPEQLGFRSSRWSKLRRRRRM